MLVDPRRWTICVALLTQKIRCKSAKRGRQRPAGRWGTVMLPSVAGKHSAWCWSPRVSDSGLWILDQGDSQGPRSMARHPRQTESTENQHDNGCWFGDEAVNGNGALYVARAKIPF